MCAIPRKDCFESETKLFHFGTNIHFTHKGAREAISTKNYCALRIVVKI